MKRKPLTRKTVKPPRKVRAESGEQFRFAFRNTLLFTKLRAITVVAYL